MAVYLLKPANPSKPPNHNQARQLGKSHSGVLSMFNVSHMVAAVNSINKVSGNRPIPNTCNTGAVVNTNTAQKPA